MFEFFKDLFKSFKEVPKKDTIKIEEYHLELFVTHTCPYCHKVLNFLEKKGIEIPLQYTDVDNYARERLSREGGKTQVPCLQINEKYLYESDDIIAWFSRHS